jgi:hypothetical protein
MNTVMDANTTSSHQEPRLPELNMRTGTLSKPSESTVSWCFRTPMYRTHVTTYRGYYFKAPRDRAIYSVRPCWSPRWRGGATTISNANIWADANVLEAISTPKPDERG